MPGAGTNALRNWRPSSLRTGMLCRFGLIAAEPAGAGHGLVERGVDAAVGGDLGQQPGAVGAAQLLDLAVLQQRIDELGPLVAQLLERRGVGREPGLGLLLRRQLLLGVQDLAQLDRRVEVERPSDDTLQLGAEPLDSRR